MILLKENIIILLVIMVTGLVPLHLQHILGLLRIDYEGPLKTVLTTCLPPMLFC